jgi:arachidonate 15-lipoxygenase
MGPGTPETRQSWASSAFPKALRRRRSIGAPANCEDDDLARYLLSQHDPRPERAEQLKAAREHYAYDMRYGFAVSAGEAVEDRPSAAWRAKTLAIQEKIRLNLLALKQRGQWNFVNDLQPIAPMRLLNLIRKNDVAGLVDFFMPIPGGEKGRDRLASLEEYRSVFALTEPPPATERFQTDEYFADMMVAGPDPTRLQRLEAVPAKFPIEKAHLAAVPELAGDDLSEALAAGRIYWVDYQDMAGLADGRHPFAPKYIYAPIAAFATPRGGGALRPFAIQCGQDPAGRAIYTPTDGYSWKIAKNCVLAAYNTRHEVLAHLGFTHLISEAVLLAAARNLASAHPISALLRRHFEGTRSINKLAVGLLIQPGRAVEYLIGAELKSAWAWLAEQRAKFSFRSHYLPSKFAAAQTDGVARLSHYPYRDDGLLVWNGLQEWVGSFVTAYYASDADVRADHELQLWATEVAASSGGGVNDFGATPGHIESRRDLVDILTMVIWTAGPEHAVVNFAQKDHQAFLPANPLAGYTPEPRGHAHTEADWLAHLPPLDVAVQQFCVMTFLGSVRHSVLGDYGKDFQNTPAESAYLKLKSDLAQIEREIVQRNKRRRHPYEYLQPSLIPNSTNV